MSAISTLAEPASAGFLLDQLSDDELVEDAREAKSEAEELEAEAGSPARWRQADDYALLVQRGWTQQAIAKSCGVSQPLVSYYTRCVERYNLGYERPVFQAAYREVQSEGSVHFSSETDLWATPDAIFVALHAEFDFELDVCATADNAKCEQFFTEEDDGLVRPWTGRCWMNPPYGRELPKWIAKAHESVNSGDAELVACLVPARTDTGWMWDY